MWKIGNVKINNRIVFAPMAGISNESFRSIIKDMGAGLIYSEMVSAYDGMPDELKKLVYPAFNWTLQNSVSAIKGNISIEPVEEISHQSTR